MPIHPLPAVPQDGDIFLRAHQGDEDAFSDLIMPWRTPLLAYLYRMVGHWEDGEDLTQDVLVSVAERVRRDPPPRALRVWLFKLATRLCFEYLSTRRRWRVDAQKIASRAAIADPEATRRFSRIKSDPGFEFDVREHVAFCLTCIGRTLPPHSQAVLMMKELFGLDIAECAEAVDVSGSVATELLAGARSEMKRALNGLCRLTDPKGRCDLCLSLRNGVPKDRRGENLERLDPEAGVEPTADSLLDARLRIAREADLETGRSRMFHRLFFDGLSHQEDPRW
ncbi:MAG: RNA polymerase sigma factor [Acidobacteriota bacterium]